MELIERIKEYLKDTFCIEYTGKMRLTIDQEGLETTDYFNYILEWPLNPEAPQQPLIMQGQFKNEDGFFEYIKKEIKTKRFFLFKDTRVIRIPFATEEENDNT